MADQDFEAAAAELRKALDERLSAYLGQIVGAVHEDVVGILRAREFALSTSNIAKAVHDRAMTSAVNGKEYPLQAIIGWTDMHASNIEAAVRFLVEQAGGEFVPGERQGNYTVRLKAAP